jgi:hypothetical protein
VEGGSLRHGNATAVGWRLMIEGYRGLRPIRSPSSTVAVTRQHRRHVQRRETLFPDEHWRRLLAGRRAFVEKRFGGGPLLTANCHIATRHAGLDGTSSRIVRLPGGVQRDGWLSTITCVEYRCACRA